MIDASNPETESMLRGRPVYVVDGRRTPFLKARGKPGPLQAADLAVGAGRSLLLEQPFEPEALDEVILGCVSPGPDEANIARVVSLRLGCGEATPAWTVQRNCASGLQALDSAAKDIATGRADLVLAGGTEAMSHHPLLFSQAMVVWLAQWNRERRLHARLRHLVRLRTRHFTPVIALLRGLTDPVVGLSMGQTAENLALQFAIPREAMDAFALRSHRHLARARDAGQLAGEIVPLYDTGGRVYTHDDGLREDTDMQRLGELKPVFDRKFGQVTAGNSAQVTDGAALLLLASEAGLKKHGLSPAARIVDIHWAGLDPSRMGLGPVYAMAPLLTRQGLDSSDVDAFEINEAFAAQVLACLAAWGDEEFCRNELARDAPFSPIDEDRLNVDGGAIAIGHPVGASGA
ncbi:MAG: acetyl-CoA C-acetyltransferase, partial [Pseudomonadota bacterium]